LAGDRVAPIHYQQHLLTGLRVESRKSGQQKGSGDIHVRIVSTKKASGVSQRP
jgi:hypothetical protein